jgi:hypothetical protein
VPHLLFSGVIVNYDKLHSSIASREFVPRIGDVMVSRWGYEALAVNQFQNNRYQKLFFDDEMAMSQSSYYGSTLIPELVKHNDACLWAHERNDAKLLKNHWETLNKGLKQLSLVYELKLLVQLKNNRAGYSSEVHDQVAATLGKARKHFNMQYQYYSKLKDAKTEALVKELKTVENVVDFKQANYNEALAEWVLEKKEVRQFEFTDNKIIQKKNPIYKNSTGEWGRAHFYAAYKRVWIWLIPTPVFNILVIWSGILVLYIALYLDILRRIIHYFENFRLRQLNKRLQKLGT